jgi:hypothetical protein
MQMNPDLRKQREEKARNDLVYAQEKHEKAMPNILVEDGESRR